MAKKGAQLFRRAPLFVCLEHAPQELVSYLVVVLDFSCLDGRAESTWAAIGLHDLEGGEAASNL